MAAHQTPKPIIHIYKEINKGKYKDTKHFELVEVKNGTSQLSELINISKDRKFANSSPDYWLKTRQGNKWSEKALTGLFRTNVRFVYKGDENHRQHIILFKFSDDAQTLTIYYFKNYFTGDLSKVLPFINE